MMREQDGPFCGSIAAAKEVGISLRQLYHWVDVLKVVEPKIEPFGIRQFRRFTAKDIKKLKGVKELLDWGYSLPAACKLVKGGDQPA